MILGDGIRKPLRPIVREKNTPKWRWEGYVFIYRYEMANLGELFPFDHRQCIQNIPRIIWEYCTLGETKKGEIRK